MNNKLSVFKNMSKDEKIKEVQRLEKKFPVNYPGYDFRLSEIDIKNLYLGRIINLLDEFGETKDWNNYENISKDVMVENYEKLFLRFIREFYPNLLTFYLEYYGIEDAEHPCLGQSGT